MASQCPNLQLLSLDPSLAGKAHALLTQAGLDCQVLGHPANCSLAALCQGLVQEELQHLRTALFDAIATLDHSRHAFRSRELGALRQRLEQLLDNLSQSRRSGTKAGQGSVADA